MRAVQFSSTGGPDVIDVREVAIPEPGRGQVRIKVEAATLNPVDVAAWAGYFGAPPGGTSWGLGCDAAGTVDAVGTGVDLALGLPVIAMHFGAVAPLKAQAEFVVVDRAGVAPAPVSLSVVNASTIPLNGLTARASLDLIPDRAGKTVLITGAAGAVGGFAVELAKLDSMTVIASAGAGDEEYVRTVLGADEFIPRGNDPVAALRALHPDGVDAVFDTAMLADRIIGSARDGGVYVTPRADAVPEPERDVTVLVSAVANDRHALERLSELAQTGALHTRIAATYSLDEASAAHRRQAAGGIRGRLVLTM